MKHLTKILSAFMLMWMVFSTGCHDESYFSESNRITGSGMLISETRSVPECKGIKLLTSGNIIFTQDSEQKIRIEADNNIIAKIITTREGDDLVIKLPQGSYTNVTINAYISLKYLQALTITGSGNFKTTKPVDLDKLTCTINGSANVSINGRCSYFNTIINGSAEIAAGTFIVKKCQAAVNGSGRLDVYVTDELDASVNGTGFILYDGNPGTIKTNINGQGKIQRKAA